MAHPIARALDTYGQTFGIRGMSEKFENISSATGFDFGSLVVHLIGFVIGGGISLGLGYDPPRKEGSTTKAPALSICLFCAATFTGLIVLMTWFFIRTGVSERLAADDVVWNVLTWTFLLFFLPMFCLGMISPQVIRLSIRDTAHAGRTAGTIYAWSTVGAIVGTFVTGYFLIGTLGTARVLFLLTVVLVGVAFVIGKIWKNTPMLYVTSMVFTGAVMFFFVIPWLPGGYTMESKYYAINVRTFDLKRNDEEFKVKALDLDHLMHSFIRPDDPTWLGYEHEYVQGELTRYARSKGPTNVLIIGGGGYTFPRWLEVKMPDVNVDVVEIDPAVTEVAHREMGLPRNTKIRTTNMDGRQFIREKAEKKHYQLVIQDAVNDLSVPYHLMTKEYNDAIKATLAPDGAYLLTLIDSIDHGELWRAAVHTMRESFKHVILVDPSGFQHPDYRSVFIVCGSDEPLDLAEIKAVAQEAYLREGEERQARIHKLDPEKLDHYLSTRKKIVLTDQYAPVDNLMSQIFRERNK
jgi:spermidine synthase